jgi:hypothetical protein
MTGAGRWYVAAAQAAAALQWTATEAFRQPASYATYSVGDLQWNHNTLKTGELFATAAEASLKGNVGHRARTV